MKRITALTWFATVVAIYHLAVLSEAPAFLGYFLPNQMHLAVSVTCALALIFILRRARAKPDSPHDDDIAGGGNRVQWFDWLLIASIVFGNGYVILFFDKIQDYGMYGALDTWGIVVALSIAIPLLEAVRRTTGWALPIIILTFVFGTIFQRFLPGLLYGTGYPLERLLYSSLVGESGIFGLPLNVAANIVIIFLIFGAMMQGAGAGKWFIDVALSLTGWSRGGPAKAAVLSSALFGSISGSPSSNVATTGVFTIPMMIKIGYRPAFAGAVESVASTGGQILPPVMGAIAFVMAEWIEVPYSEVAIAALVPALVALDLGTVGRTITVVLGVVVAATTAIEHFLASGQLVSACDCAIPYGYGCYFVCPPGYLSIPKVQCIREWLLAEAAAAPQPAKVVGLSAYR